jgi:ATP-dependent DNA ligase
VPTTPPTFMAFDCLYVNGHDLRPHSLRERRAVLEEEICDQRLVLPVRRLAADGMKRGPRLSARGYERLVAKEDNAPYRLSTRWLKSSSARRGAS